MAFHATPASEAGTPPAEAKMAAMGAPMGEMAQQGIIRGGEGLLPSSKGARVYYENGKRSVIDGPFAETKELIAGICIVEVASKDEAIAWAKKGALVEGDCVSEIRRIYDAADFGDLQEKVPEVFEKERKFRESAQS
ncbi:MAG: YciI family protein [Polyangiaceae bacterium]